MISMTIMFVQKVELYAIYTDNVFNIIKFQLCFGY